MVRPVFADYVLQHFPTPAVTEVRINIGHADPFRIQEPFKEQVKIQRIDVGNVQQIGYNGTGSAAPARPYGNGIRVASCVGMAAAVMDKVPHNEEVCRVSHGFDDAQLVLQPFMNLFFFFATCFFRQFCQQRAIPFRNFFLTKIAHVSVRIVMKLCRNRELRQQQLAESQIYIAPFRNGVGVMQRLFIFREQGPHILIAFAVIPVVIETHPVRIVHILVGLDAKQHVLSRGVLPFHVMDIVGYHQLHPVFFRKNTKLPVHGPLFFQIMVLHFQKEIVFTENVNIFLQGLLCPVKVPLQNQPGYFPLDAGGKADDPLAVFPQDIFIDAGFAVKPVNETKGHQPGQIVIAFLVFRQQDQVIAGLLVNTVEPAARRNVTLAAEDDLDTRFSFLFRFFVQFLRSLIHVHQAVHIAVVRHGDTVHAQLHGPLQQLLRFGGAV